MVILTEHNLGKRQQELNTIVEDAARKSINFDDIKIENETDVDRIFKIDLASKYKRIDYIIETLKSGDSLYVTRAMKCIWIYDDEYSNVVNPDYIHHNIIPYMSFKMRNKFLSTVAIYVTNEERSSCFYTYCLSAKLKTIAYKFLLSTSEKFKLDFIATGRDFSNFNRPIEYLQNFIGSSFILLEAYTNRECRFYGSRNRFLYELRSLYTISNEKYLDLLEQYYSHPDLWKNWNVLRFGSRISKDIIQKHKSRVLKNATLYLNLLNKKIVTRHSTSVDAKIYALAVLAPDADKFWSIDYYHENRYFIDLIPHEEIFDFIKSIFTQHYPGHNFVMARRFYDLQYYKMMTKEQREEWAFQHLATNEELLGKGKDYIWYQFINFKKSLFEIRRYIMITSDQSIRSDMVNILVNCTSNEMELETLLNYYYERHVNEDINYKYAFLENIIRHNKIFQLSESCWTAFNKILYSIEVYDLSGKNNCREVYRTLALIYHIIHNIQLPDGLLDYLDTYINAYNVKFQCRELPEEKSQIVYDFILKFYLEKIKNSGSEPYTEEIKETVCIWIERALNLIEGFGKAKEDIPDIVMKFVDLWSNRYINRYGSLQTPQDKEVPIQNDLIRKLKRNAELAVLNIDKLKKIIEDSHQRFRLDRFLKKVKVYFWHDIAIKYLNVFHEILKDPKLSLELAFAAVNGILIISNDNEKNEFVLKYVPKDPKIDHSKIDPNLLHIQESICRFAYFSRPPVPLENILQYLKGDYVHFCLGMFNSYYANLPLPEALKFVESILDAPLSIQKHGIRLAFKSFTVEHLNKVITHAWGGTKNVTFRMVIYDKLITKINDNYGIPQQQLFEVLNGFTLDLHDDDLDEMFNLLVANKVPHHLRGKFLESVWKVVSGFPDKPTNWDRQTNVIKCIESNINLMNDDAVRAIVDDHLRVMLTEKQIRPKYERYEIDNLNSAKWELVANYIVTCNDEKQINNKLNTLQFIMNKCFESWTLTHNVTFTYRQILWGLITHLDSKSENNLKLINNVFETILNGLLQNVDRSEIYLTIWQIKVKIIARIIIQEDKRNVQDSASKYVSEIVNIIKECLANEEYHTSFFNDILYVIQANLDAIGYYRFNNEELRIYVALAFSCFEMKETFLLALKILPTECSRCDDVYKSVIDRLKASTDKEIQCAFYEKFVKSGFVKRKYI